MNLEVTMKKLLVFLALFALVGCGMPDVQVEPGPAVDCVEQCVDNPDAVIAYIVVDGVKVPVTVGDVTEAAQ